MDFPTWTPKYLRDLYAACVAMTPEQLRDNDTDLGLIKRLTFDPRMKWVWREVMRHTPEESPEDRLARAKARQELLSFHQQALQDRDDPEHESRLRFEAAWIGLILNPHQMKREPSQRDDLAYAAGPDKAVVAEWLVDAAEQAWRVANDPPIKQSDLVDRYAEIAEVAGALQRAVVGLDREFWNARFGDFPLEEIDVPLSHLFPIEEAIQEGLEGLPLEDTVVSLRRQDGTEQAFPFSPRAACMLMVRLGLRQNEPTVSGFAAKVLELATASRDRIATATFPDWGSQGATLARRNIVCRYLAPVFDKWFGQELRGTLARLAGVILDHDITRKHVDDALPRRKKHQ